MQLRHINLANFNAMSLSSLALKPNDIVYVQPNRAKSINISTDNALAPLNVITKVAAPFVSIKTLTTN
jgi:polysaccharide export outer membrane protein